MSPLSKAVAGLAGRILGRNPVDRPPHPTQAATAPAMKGLRCSVCGGGTFKEADILGGRLIAEWELSAEEAACINLQQGCQCLGCGSNLRSIALAAAIRSHLNIRLPLREADPASLREGFAVLELNEAGTLTSTLRRLPGHVFGAYPEVDMQALPYADQSFDLVVHSDTLEHLPDPVRALAQCRRVLKPGGALCFTVPIVVGRLSRNRAGLPDSFHGGQLWTRRDFLVHTEFGADAWTFAMAAGFDAVEMVAVAYPAGLALIARRLTAA